MKKYIQPSTEVIEMELAMVVATSLGEGSIISFQDGTSDEMDAPTRRNNDWSSYEDR